MAESSLLVLPAGLIISQQKSLWSRKKREYFTVVLVLPDVFRGT